MQSGDNGHWRRFVVDVLIGAATLVVAFSAMSAAAGVPYMLLLSGALVGIGLILEPSAAAEAAGDIGAQHSEWSAEPELHEPGSLPRFDPALVDLASV